MLSNHFDLGVEVAGLERGGRTRTKKKGVPKKGRREIQFLTVIDLGLHCRDRTLPAEGQQSQHAAEEENSRARFGCLNRRGRSVWKANTLNREFIARIDLAIALTADVAVVLARTRAAHEQEQFGRCSSVHTVTVGENVREAVVEVPNHTREGDLKTPDGRAPADVEGGGRVQIDRHRLA